MATNKHALIRYHALDQCFSNPGKRYFIDDLIEACNNALFEYSDLSEGVKRRQVFEDIKFMESSQGWSIPLERIKDGKQVFYRYTDRKFSIKNQVVNEDEAKKIKEALSVLTRFKGMPQFEWMEEMQVRIESAFNFQDRDRIIVSFEQNPYLKGLHFFTELFNAIQYKRPIEIQYQGFKQSAPVKMLIHPYYLKQYNSRWFLFGYNPELKALSNLALDRIVQIEDSKEKYIENEQINFEEHFDDVVGVTVQQGLEAVKVKLEVNKTLWPYIKSKPIHGSQKIIAQSDTHVVIELLVQINYELISDLFGYGEPIKVLAPDALAQSLKNKAETLLKNYK